MRDPSGWHEAIPVAGPGGRGDPAEICVWGGGLAGYSLALAFAEDEGESLVVDVAEPVPRRINAGQCPLGYQPPGFPRPTPDVAARIKATLTTDDVVRREIHTHVICVPTERNAEPWAGPLTDVVERLAAMPRTGGAYYIIVSSTVPPVWVDDIVHARLRQHGWVHGQHYHLACAPRRDVFSDRDYALGRISIVVGADSVEGAAHARRLFGRVCREVHVAADAKAAALCKIIENLYRHQAIDLSIRLAAALPGQDVPEVLRLAGTKWNMDTYHPSLGIGGYCVPLARRYLAECVDGAGADWLNEIGASVEVLLDQLVEALGRTADGDRIAVLGLSYAPGLRVHSGSPSLRVIERLRTTGRTVAVHDPHYEDEQVRALVATERLDFPFGLRDYACVIVMTAHPEYQRISDREMASYLPDRLTVIDNTGAWRNRNFPTGVSYLEVGTPAYFAAVRHWKHGGAVAGRALETEDDAVLAACRAHLHELEQSDRLAGFYEDVDRILEIDREYLYAMFEGERYNIPALRERLVGLRQREVASWSDNEVDVMCALASFGMAWVRLEYVDMNVNMRGAMRYLRSTAAAYVAHLARAGESHAPFESGAWWEIAPKVAALRQDIDRHWYRLAHINGENWFRREVLLSRNAVDAQPVPEHAAKAIRDLYGIDVGSQHGEQALREVTRAVIKAEGSSISLIEAMLRIAAEDSLYPSDFATLLCPRGTNLDHPWDMTREDFLAFVVFNRSFVPPADQGVGDYTLIRKAMLAHHSAKKARLARKYRARYGVNSRASLADNLGDLGFYYNEDRYHKGHAVSGIVCAMRYLMSIEFEHEANKLTVEGLTDFRVTRTSRAEAARFRIEEFPPFHKFGTLLRPIIETTFEQGVVLPALIGNWR